jgi:hypothetical protein
MAMAVSGWPQAKQAAPPRRFTVEVGEGKNGGRRLRGGEPSAAHLLDADAHIFASSRSSLHLTPHPLLVPAARVRQANLCRFLCKLPFPLFL